MEPITTTLNQSGTKVTMSYLKINANNVDSAMKAFHFTPCIQLLLNFFKITLCGGNQIIEDIYK